MLLKIITNTLKKVLFSDDKNTQHVHNICCSWIKTDFRCNFIVMILTRTGLHRVFHFSLTLVSAWKYDDKLLDAKEEDNFKVILQIMNYLSTPHLFLHANEENIGIKTSLRHKPELFGHYFTDTWFLMTRVLQ